MTSRWRLLIHRGIRDDPGLDNGHPPEQLLARIAHKHASLGVTREQYAIVHEHLFAAIVQVLGEAVTPEVAAAWDELYWHMADDLVGIEQGLYSEAGVEPGEVWRQVVASGRQQESPDTVAFSLAAVDGSALPTAEPGQYISVTVSLPDGANQIRQYSLTRGRADGWAISGKRCRPPSARQAPRSPKVRCRTSCTATCSRATSCASRCLRRPRPRRG